MSKHLHVIDHEQTPADVFHTRIIINADTLSELFETDPTPDILDEAERLASTILADISRLRGICKNH